MYKLMFVHKYDFHLRNSTYYFTNPKHFWISESNRKLINDRLDKVRHVIKIIIEYLAKFILIRHSRSKVIVFYKRHNKISESGNNKFRITEESMKYIDCYLKIR